MAPWPMGKKRRNDPVMDYFKDGGPGLMVCQVKRESESNNGAICGSEIKISDEGNKDAGKLKLTAVHLFTATKKVQIRPNFHWQSIWNYFSILFSLCRHQSWEFEKTPPEVAS